MWVCPKCNLTLEEKPTPLEVSMVFHLCKRNKDQVTKMRFVDGVSDESEE